MELNYVSNKTILFSDRPDRIVTSVTTSNFVGNWSKGQDSFAVDAPNAVLVVDEIAGQQDIGIIELYNPKYSGDTKVLQYDFVLIGNQTPIDLPNEFDQSTLIIDDSQIGFMMASFFKFHQHKK